MRLTTHIGEYEIDQIILDLESNVNVLMKHTWELMGKKKLQWSLIQVRMENQQNIFAMGRLPGATLDIERVNTTVDFEVTEIVDES